MVKWMNKKERMTASHGTEDRLGKRFAVKNITRFL
jgi:hypothetical protein